MIGTRSCTASSYPTDRKEKRVSISNRKPGDKKEAPTEPLKRSIAACLRAIARKPDLEVTFASDRPILMSDKARLPEPPRKLNRQDVSIVRGHADSMALRLACHDAGIHRRLAPEAQATRAVFDAVEQARVEAIGSRRMSGVADNLSAMLEDATIAAASTRRSPTGPTHRSRTRSRSWSASGSPASSRPRRRRRSS